MAIDTLRSVLVTRDPEIYSGDAVFGGTRVPVETLVDYLEGGDSIEDFLENFPSVRREQAMAALQLLREILERIAGSLTGWHTASHGTRVFPRPP